MTVKSVWLGDKIKGRVRLAAVGGLLQTARHVKNESQRIVPRKTDDLHNAAYADVDPDTLIAIAGYDVQRDIKTIKQHEDLSYRHPQGESAKFLEKPLQQAQQLHNQNLSRVLRQVFR